MKIIMYHYVRDYKNSKYKNLKALSFENFKRQIKFLKKNYKFYNPNTHLNGNLNKSLCWLTFDDGYIDHYNNVLPILEENNIKGSFFITSNIENKSVLEVNKIQFILEKKNTIFLIDQIKKIYREIKKLHNNDELDLMIKSIKLDHRYDDKNTIIVKRLLQREIPNVIRKKIINILFKKYVCKNDLKFHKELYLNLKQLKIMRKLGHEIGNHTKNHKWLSKLKVNDQELEIKDNLKFLKKNKLIKDKWTMCYPYGDFNTNTISILKKYKCSRALTTVVNKVNKKSNIFKLPRLNTNDFYPISIK